MCSAALVAKISPSMHESLRHESEKLARSWARHDAAWLRDYLVAGVEDPRLNLQSILSRHFLIRALTGERFAALMTEECRFAGLMNWLADFAHRAGDLEQLQVLHHALRRNADNAEGAEIPHYVRQAFTRLPTTCDAVTIPNYIEVFLSATSFANGVAELPQPILNTFQQIWQSIFSSLPSIPSSTHHALCVTSPSFRTPDSALRTLLEPACGSANDYRFLHSFGLARFFAYTGFDLAEKNISNARGLFPTTVNLPQPDSAPLPPVASFQIANVLEIPAPGRSFEFCVVHDLFEHLSLPAFEIAVSEICRVTHSALCLGFFQMDEIPDHIVRPVDDYHINLLSVLRTKALFAAHGFEAQVIHIATFLRSEFACDFCYNPHAYTFILRARR